MHYEIFIFQFWQQASNFCLYHKQEKSFLFYKITKQQTDSLLQPHQTAWPLLFRHNNRAICDGYRVHDSLSVGHFSGKSVNSITKRTSKHCAFFFVIPLGTTNDYRGHCNNRLLSNRHVLRLGHDHTELGLTQSAVSCSGTPTDPKRVSLQSNHMYDALFSLNWYHLPLEKQRIYQTLLHHSQRPQVIYIAGITALNMETCVSVRIRKVSPYIRNLECSLSSILSYNCCSSLSKTLKGVYSYGMIFSTVMWRRSIAVTHLNLKPVVLLIEVEEQIKTFHM